MKNILNISILVILVAGLFSAEIDLSAVDIGDRSRKAVTDMNESLDKLAQQYFEATEKIKSDAVKNLEKERSRTKDGLVALGIQHQIEQIGKMAPPIDLLGNTIKKAPDLTGTMTLTWGGRAHETSQIILEKDGKLTPLNEAGKPKHDDFHAKWTLEDGVLSIWAHSGILTCMMVLDDQGTWRQDSALQQQNHFLQLNYRLERK